MLGKDHNLTCLQCKNYCEKTGEAPPSTNEDIKYLLLKVHLNDIGKTVIDEIDKYE
jgi:hypothetical protein